MTVYRWYHLNSVERKLISLSNKDKVPKKQKRKTIVDISCEYVLENSPSDTGLPGDMVFQIYDYCKEDIALPRGNESRKVRSCLCTILLRLYMALGQFRHGFSYRKCLNKQFGVSQSFLSKDFQHILPILYEKVFTFPGFSLFLNLN